LLGETRYFVSNELNALSHFLFSCGVVDLHRQDQALRKTGPSPKSTTVLRKCVVSNAEKPSAIVRRERDAVTTPPSGKENVGRQIGSISVGTQPATYEVSVNGVVVRPIEIREPIFTLRSLFTGLVP
jgi:hypothetical protein